MTRQFITPFFTLYLQSPVKSEKESSQPTSEEPSSDSAYYGTAAAPAAYRDSRDSMTR